MSMSSPIVQRVVTQQPRSDVIFHAESSDGAFAENGIHVNFETASFYTKRAGSDAVVFNRIQDMFTFTGGNQSKYCGSNGLLQSAATNTPRLEYSSSTTGTNLLQQSQTIASSPWTLGVGTSVSDTVIAPNGTLTADKYVEDVGGTFKVLAQTFNFVAGNTYTFSVYIKLAQRNAVQLILPAGAFTTQTFAFFNCTTGALGVTQNTPTTTTTDVGNGWFRVSMTKAATVTASVAVNILPATDATNAASNNYSGDGSSGIYLWGAQLEIASAPSVYTATTSTVPAYTNSTPTFLGMLMESSKTNFCLSSEDFTTTAANHSAVGLNATSTNATQAPDGTNTADFISEDTSGTQHRIRQTTDLTITSASTNTYSVFVKANQKTKVSLRMTDTAFTTSIDCIFNLATGTAGTPTNTGVATGGTARIIPFLNGWYRISITGAINGAVTTIRNLVELLDSAGTTITYTGDGTSGLYVWGEQFEAGCSFASSYIPTTTVAVARTADVCTRTLGSEYSTAAGTAVVVGRWGTVDSTTGQSIFSFGDGTINNRINLLRPQSSSTARLNVTTATALQFTLDFSLTDFATYKAAIAWAPNNFAYSYNGSTVQVSTTGTLPTVTFLELGHIASLSQMNCHIKQFDYWPVKYADGFLELAAGDEFEQGIHLDFISDTYYIKNATTSVRTNGTSVTNFFTLTSGNQSMYVGPTGTLVQSVANTPRIEYDPVTLRRRGLLCEASRTNLFLQSSNLGTTWVPSLSTVALNQTTAPDGTLTADKLIGTSGTNAMTISQPSTLSATTAYTMSVFVKYIPGECQFMMFRSDVDGASIVSFDIKNGLIITTSLPWFNARIEAYPNGWYRCSAAYTTVGTAYNMRIYLDNTGNSGSFTGDGVKGMYLWGAQMELGQFVTSYIPTTTATVTRAADVYLRTASSEYLATNGGTMSVQGRTQLGRDVNNQFFAMLITGADSVLFLRPANSDLARFNLFTGGVAQGPCDNTLTNGQQFKEVYAWNTNDMAASFNGGAVVTDNTVTLGTYGTFVLGGDNSPTLQANAWISKFDYTPGRKSNGRLVALST